MSLNPQIGHLYHDFSITNSYTVLDAKEKMKTREINARETKYLDKYACGLEKAKLIYQNNNEREQRNIRKHLDNIITKTISLDKGLKRESQRLKLFDDVLNEAYTKTKSAPFTKANQSTKNSRRPNFVSAKSLYWNIHLEQRDSERNERIDNAIDLKQNVLLPTTTKLIRKADNITKTLHKLYTKNLERRWKDTNRTISDVLSSETNEELEKALFVLRGTHAGTLIEDILRERVLARRDRSNSYGTQNWSLSSSGRSQGLDEQVTDDVFVTEINVRDRVERMMRVKDNKLNTLVQTGQSEALKLHNKFPNIDKGVKSNNKSTEWKSPEGNISVESSDDYIGNLNEIDNVKREELIVSKPLLQSESLPSVSGETKEKEIRSWINVSEINLDLNEVFKRDDPDSMSSTIVNPSENEYVPTMKWREIFKTPEVWKQTKRVVQKMKKPKPIGLVKVHGQYRQTMLK